MFLRSKKHQLPSYIEGTQGRYVRRASPPPVPSLTCECFPSLIFSPLFLSAHSIVKRATISGGDTKHSISTLASSSGVSSAQSQQEIGSPTDSEGSIRRPSIVSIFSYSLFQMEMCFARQDPFKFFKSNFFKIFRYSDLT